MSEVWAGLAVARAALQRNVRYPINLVSQVVTPVLSVLLPSFLLAAAFSVDGSALGLQRSSGTGDAGGFLILGVVVTNLVLMTFWHVSYALRAEMEAGTLEPLWLTPTGRDTLVLGRALAVLVVFMLSQLAILLVGLLYFDVRLSPAALLALPAIALAGIAMLGPAYLTIALLFALKDVSLLLDVSSLAISQLSGVAFPLTLLPRAFQLAAMIIPTTLALDLLRHFALGTVSLADPGLEYAALFALALALPAVGRLGFVRAERRMRRDGSLGMY